MTRWMTGVALAGALAATAARAGGPPPSGALDLPLEGDQTPAVVDVPSNAQMTREYPPLALALALGGSAAMTCVVETSGLLDDCKLDSESPADLGFGAAALRLAPYFTAKPPTLQGHAVKGTITVPIRFATADGPDPEVAPIPAPTSPAALIASRELATVNGWPAEMRAFGEKAFEQWTQSLAGGGDAIAATRVLDDLRAGIDDAVAQVLDNRERLLASQMTADQLRATIAFMSSPAGIAYRQVQTETDSGKYWNFWQIVKTAARRRLCADPACAGRSAGAPSSRPAQSFTP